MTKKKSNVSIITPPGSGVGHSVPVQTDPLTTYPAYPTGETEIGHPAVDRVPNPNPTPYEGPGSGANTGPDQSQGGAPHAGTTPAVDIDWADVYFGQWGLPSDLKAAIQALGAKYGASNPDVFYNAALNAIHGSQWFSTTFPGFFEGVRAGLFTNETGYRDYVSQANQHYRNYTGRDVTGAEVQSALTEGISTDVLGRRFAGSAYEAANQGDYQYAAGAFGEGGNSRLSSSESLAYGREKAGIDTPLGQAIQRRIDMAKQRMTSVFQGALANANLSLGTAGISAPGMNPRGQSPDVGA